MLLLAVTIAAGLAVLPAILPAANASVAGNGSDGQLINNSKIYKRTEYADAQPSDCYVFSATVRITALNADSKVGLNAGSNILPHNMDFLFDNGRKEFTTYATLYNADRRTDLGYRYMLTGNTGNELSLTVVRQVLFDIQPDSMVIRFHAENRIRKFYFLSGLFSHGVINS